MVGCFTADQSEYSDDNPHNPLNPRLNHILAGSSSGRTGDSGSLSPGSNPGPAVLRMPGRVAQKFLPVAKLSQTGMSVLLFRMPGRVAQKFLPVAELSQTGMSVLLFYRPARKRFKL